MPLPNVLFKQSPFLDLPIRKRSSCIFLPKLSLSSRAVKFAIFQVHLLQQSEFPFVVIDQRLHVRPTNLPINSGGI